MEDLRKKLLKYIPELISSITDLSVHYHNGDLSKAVDGQDVIIEGINWVCGAYVALTGDEDKITSLNEHLKNITEAMLSKDYILVGDIFEFDIIELLKIILSNIDTKH
jgi:plasmid replication initiation protein